MSRLTHSSWKTLTNRLVTIAKRVKKTPFLPLALPKKRLCIVSEFINICVDYLHVVCINMPMAIIGSSGALGEFPTPGTSRYPLPSDYTNMPRIAHLRPVNEDSNKFKESDVETPLVDNCEDVEQVCFCMFCYCWKQKDICLSFSTEKRTEDLAITILFFLFLQREAVLVVLQAQLKYCIKNHGVFLLTKI